jgi:hypothetical protein
MDARNIAICLAPTLLNMNNIKDISTTTTIASPIMSQSPHFKNSNHHNSTTFNSIISTSNQQTLLYSRQCNATLDCLTYMIENAKRVFQIPNEAYTKCQFTKSDLTTPLTLNELLGNLSNSMLNLYINDRIEEMLKELRDKQKNWHKLRSHNSDHAARSMVEICFKNIEDSVLNLRLWKFQIEIDAPAKEILSKILMQKTQWSEDVTDHRVLQALNSQTDIVQYLMHLMPPNPTREFVELRCWKEATHINYVNNMQTAKRSSYFVYSTSIEYHAEKDEQHQDQKLTGDFRSNTMRSFFLIEPNPNNLNKCLVYHLYRADLRGFSNEWYNKIQPHLVKQNLLNLKECFVNPKRNFI